MNKLENLKCRYSIILEKKRLEDIKAELEKEVIIHEVGYTDIESIKNYYSEDFYSEIDEIMKRITRKMKKDLIMEIIKIRCNCLRTSTD